MIKVERVTLETGFDGPQIIRLISRLAADRGTVREPMTDQDIKEVLANPNYYLLVAMDEGEYIGLLSVVFQRDFGRWLCGAYNLVVEQDSRQKGVSALLRDMSARTRQAFSDQHGVEIHCYYTTNSPYVLGSSFQKLSGFTTIAKADGPMGTNLCKSICYPKNRTRPA